MPKKAYIPSENWCHDLKFQTKIFSGSTFKRTP